MKRRVAIILLFLLAGAVVNVAVAWACSLSYAPTRHPTFFRNMTSPADIAWWDSRKPAGFPDMALDVATLSRFGLWVRRVVAAEEVDIDDFRFTDDLGEMRAGWPLKCFEGSVWFHYDWTRGFHRIPDAVLLTNSGPRARWVPVRPIGVGFAANVPFYGLVLWVCIRGPFILRAHLRRMHGRCPACAYDLRGEFVAGCPECGWGREEGNT